MSDHILKTISEVQGQVEEIEAQLIHKKRMVNDLRGLANLDPLYHDIEKSSASSGAIRSDQFYGQPLATVVHNVLKMRQQAMNVNDIYASMLEGGYSFEAKSDNNAKRSLRISLSKNTAKFHKLPNGTFGLLEWYPNVKNSCKTKDEPQPSSEVNDDDVKTEFHEESAEASEKNMTEDVKAMKG